MSYESAFLDGVGMQEHEIGRVGVVVADGEDLRARVQFQGEAWNPGPTSLATVRVYLADPDGSPGALLEEMIWEGAPVSEIRLSDPLLTNEHSLPQHFELIVTFDLFNWGGWWLELDVAFEGCLRAAVPRSRWVARLFGLRPGTPHISDPVNAFTGNFTDTWSDLALPPGAGPITWGRSYNSLDEVGGVLGQGWTTSLDVSIRQDYDGTVVLLDADGRRVRWEPDGADGYQRPYELAGELVRRLDGWWELRHRSGDIWQFHWMGHLESIVGWDGTVATVTRDDLYRPTSVVADTGYGLEMSYGPDGLLESVETTDGRTLGFDHDEDGFLGAVTLPDGGVQSFEVDDEGRIVEITDPAGRRVVTNVYDEFGRVVEQTSPDGDTVTFDYDDVNFATTVTDAHSGDVTVYVHDGEGRMVSITDAAGAVVERDYDQWGNVTAFVDRRAGSYGQVFDDAGNLVSSTRPDGSTVTNTWDAQNRLVSSTDAAGNTTTYTYAGEQRIPTTVTDPDGGVTTIESTGGLIERVVDPDGVETVFDYDTARNLVSVTDGEGNTTSYTYDPAGRVVSVTSPLGHVSSFTHDPAGRVLTETDPAGAVTSFVYNAAGDVVSVTDPLGAVTSYAYGPSGRLESVTDPEGNVTTHTYDPSGDLVAVTRPGGATTTYSYGPLARLLKVVSAEGVETHFGYDADGNRTTTVLGPDPADPARTSRSVFDALGRITEQLGPIGALSATGDAVRSRSTTTYDTAGRVIETTRGEGVDLVRTWFRYDDAGRLRFEIVDLDGDGAFHDPASADPAERDPADRVTEYTYTPAGRLFEIIHGPAGVDEFDWMTGDESAKRVTTHTYDDAGRLILVVDPLAGTTATWYDADGRVERTETPGGAISRFEYDPAGRVLAQYTPSPAGVGESVERWVYDLAGRAVEHAAPHDPTASASAPRSTFGYHPTGTLAWVRDPRQDIWGDRVETRFAYDGRGNLVEQRSWSNDNAADPDDWSEIVETWAWDLDDRLVAHTRPGGGTTTYAYDPATGWLSSITQPSGRVETLAYWPGGAIREQRWSMPDAADVVVSRWHDSLGRQTKIGDPTGDTTYSWDRNSALTGVVGPSESTTFGYDQHGHRTRIGYPWGFDAHYDLDPLGRPVALTQGGIERASWTFDADGRVLTETIGPDASGGTATWAWPANGAHRPVGYQQQLADNPLRTYSLAWDHDGNLVEQTRNGVTETFIYDAAGQLLSRQRGDESWTWTYNTRGLITHTTSSTAAGNEARHTNFDADGRPTTGTSHWTNGWVVPTSYDHDSDGRLTQARLATTPVFEAAYDQRGLPISITTHWDGQPQTTQRVYDGDGYLVGLDPGTGTQPLTWDRTRPDGDILATHRLGTRQGLVSYLYGPAGGVGVHYGPGWLGGINRDPHASNLNHYFLDGYDPWGNPEGVTAPARFGLGYRGELVVDGLIHLRNRDYHPTLHTFTSPDPLKGVPATPTLNNRYHYANNNPYTYTDPLGLRARNDDFRADDFMAQTCPLVLQMPQPGAFDWSLEARTLRDAIPACRQWMLQQSVAGQARLRLERAGEAYSDLLYEISGAADLERCTLYHDRISCAWAALGLIPGGGPDDAGRGLARILGLFRRAPQSSFDDLTHSIHGIRSYADQRAVTAGQRGQAQAHHLIEQRFANVMGGSTSHWPSIVVTPAEHQQFTNAWRQAIPYGAGTRTATRAQVEAAARQIYADYPEILRALDLG